MMTEPKDLIFQKSQEGKLKIPKLMVKEFSSFSQSTTSQPEAGGILMGRFIQNTPDIVIDSMTVPMEGDQRTRCSFFLHKKRHQEVLTQNWMTSKGTCNYLGEWHTHPQPIPIPSETDLKRWEKILKEDVFDSASLFFLIVGIKEIFIWEGIKSSFLFKKLTQVL